MIPIIENYKWIKIVTWSYVIVYKILVFNKNTLNDSTVWKLLELDKNTWYNCQ